MEKIDLSEHLNSTTPVTWLFAGDSITQGAKHTRGGRDFSQHFKERLGETGRNEDVVINSAVGGWSYGSFVPRFEDRVNRYKPDVLFMMFGTNDAAKGKEHLGKFSKELEEAVTKARAAKIKTIILMTTVPMIPVIPEAMIDFNQFADPKMKAGKLNGLKVRSTCLTEFALETISSAKRLNVPLIDNWHAFIDTKAAFGQLMDNGFHPNEFGHLHVAHTIFKSCGLWDESSWVCRMFVPSY